eukprot:12397710-Karenia_brevis.AAC.1
MSIIFKKVQARLKNTGLIHEIKCTAACSPLLSSPVIALVEASYVDDVVLPLVADAPVLLDVVAAAVAVVGGVFRAH